jgi:2-hydroxychromene-2-carboxylate isomerase
MAASAAPAAFYFDLASPEAYLAAERVLQVIPGPCEWRPIVAAERSIRLAEIERRAASLGLQPIVWPEPFPFDSHAAMLAATYAKQIGRAVAFAQAAFRQAFAGGHALSDRNFVLISAAACEMHPNAVVKALETRTVADELAAATVAARELGVSDVPAVTVGGRVFVGERELEAAAAQVGAIVGATAP